MIASKAEYKMKTVGWFGQRHLANHQKDRYVEGKYIPTRREAKAMRQSKEAKK